ncbi:hypothetical protein SEA_STELLA_89 [Streptomyces phage Stella]|nr:hypothetical protein SEA_STELLA_89 [Streptomyces phage Stella]
MRSYARGSSQVSAERSSSRGHSRPHLPALHKGGRERIYSPRLWHGTSLTPEGVGRLARRPEQVNHSGTPRYASRYGLGVFTRSSHVLSSQTTATQSRAVVPTGVGAQPTKTS